MRTIKFRGKRVDGKGWCRGLLALNKGDENSYFLQSPLYDSDGYRGYQQYEVTPETVGQFTGLKDKNGKEIYEGDIVNFKAESPYPFIIMTGVVKYEPCKFYLADDINEIGIHVDNWYELEVIGNIHDNPELLGGSK